MYARRRTHRTKTKIISWVWILLPFVTKAFLVTGELTKEKVSMMSSFCGFWGQACLVKVKQLEEDQLLLRLGALQVWLPSTPGAVCSNKKLTFILYTVFQPASHREIGELRVSSPVSTACCLSICPLALSPSPPCPLLLPTTFIHISIPVYLVAMVWGYSSLWGCSWPPLWMIDKWEKRHRCMLLFNQSRKLPSGKTLQRELQLPGFGETGKQRQRSLNLVVA